VRFRPGPSRAAAGVRTAYAFGLLSLGLLYLVAFTAGTFSVLFAVSYSVLFVSVVPRGR
jgi:sulfite exporter TauE/SafE